MIRDDVNLEAAVDIANGAVRAAMEELGAIIRDDVRESLSTPFPPKAPPGEPPHRRTGRLAGSISYRTVVTSTGVTTVIFVDPSRFTDNPMIPIWLERGNAKVKARPYMEPKKMEWAARAGQLLPSLIRSSR